MILGLNVLFQSLGVIYLKPTRDPLERISYLGYMQLVSINQRINEEFLEVMCVDAQWSDLTAKQK